MQRTPDGGFKWLGQNYIPLIVDATIRNPYVRKNPHLFYSGENGVVVTAYPGVTQTSYGDNGIGICGLAILMSGNTKYSYIYPTFNEDGDLYGSINKNAKCVCDEHTLTRACNEHTHERKLVERALSKISDEYRREVVSMNISHLQLQFTQDLGFANLTEVVFNWCDLVEMPPLASLRNLRKVSLAGNPRLTELPYDFLKHRVGELTLLNLFDTGIQCIWGRIPAKLTLERWYWFLPDRLNKLVADSAVPDYRRELCSRMAEPVVRAAAAVLSVQKSGAVKGFHRDIARMIAGMILETKGRAVWRPVYDSMYK
jgi:hypothetical protein